MTAIGIPDELASQIEHGAQRAGQSGSTFLWEAVLSRLEDLVDMDVATERINNPGERIPFAQVKKNLGIDD